LKGSDSGTVGSLIAPRTSSTHDLQALTALDRAGLCRLWHERAHGPIPPKASRWLLIYCLAYRIQADAHGGLSDASRTRLRSIAQQLGSVPPKTAENRLMPGTRLIRQWHEQRHEVTVLESGYAYRGERYASLSAIARAISGMHCSGPRFFGLKSRSTSRPSPADGI
jgi:hypothetical protein